MGLCFFPEDSQTRENQKRIQQKFCAVIEKIGVIKKEDSILDFGAGSGSLATVLQANGYSVDCLEPEESSVRQIVQAGIQNVFRTAKALPKKKYSLIIMKEVIEHLDDPVTILQELLPACADDVRVFVTTPSSTTIKSRFFRNHPGSAFHTDSHLHFFSRKSLNQCMKRSGLKHFEKVHSKGLMGCNSAFMQFAQYVLQYFGLAGGLQGLYYR